MKKILLCYHSAQFGGVEKHILDIISGLSKEFEIFVACPNGPLVKDYLEAGAKKHFNICPRFEADFLYSLKIKKIVTNEKIDVIHSHELLTGSLATFGGWMAKCPKRIYHVHTSFTQWRYPAIKKYPALFINTIVNFIVGNFFATDVIALTESVKKIRVKKEFINTRKIRVIPNGIHLEQFKYDIDGRNQIRQKLNINENQFVIGNIARFTKEKGHKILLEAFRKLDNSRKSDFVLVLAGDGILKNDIQLRVREYNLQDKVHFLGNFAESEKSKILSSFDCFAFPSYAEGFGIALVEAMSVGIPTVASDLDVLKDVGGGSILYFKKGSDEDLKNKILELTSNFDNIKDIQQREISRANNFSIQKFWQAYSNLYNS